MAKKLKTPNCPALCNFSTWDWQKNRKPKKMKKKSWRSRRKVFVTSYRFSYCGRGFSLLFLGVRRRFTGEGVLTLTIVLFTWPPTFLSQCVCLLIYIAWLNLGQQQLFLLTLMPGNQQVLKKGKTNQVCVSVGYLSVSPPVCGPLLSFGLLNELDFYRFRLAFPLFHFLSFWFCVSACVYWFPTSSTWLDLTCSSGFHYLYP